MLLLGPSYRRRRFPVREQDLAGLANLCLTLSVVVVKLDLTDWEAILMVEQHENDARRKGAAAAGDDDG